MAATHAAVHQAVPRSAGRRTSAGRAIAAAQEPFPVVLSPSPLIRTEPLPTGKPKPFVRYTTEAELVAAFRREDPLAKEQERLTEFYTIVKGRTTLLSLPDALLRRAFLFLGAELTHFVPLTRVCKRFYYLTFDLVSSVTLVPSLMSIDQLSKRGSMTSLAKHLSKLTRGTHVLSFSVLDSKSVAELPRHVFGPTVSKLALQAALPNMPMLTKLDIRGVLLRDHSCSGEHFLADLFFLCPKLQQLKIGPSLVRCWEPLWWQRLANLTEFVVGSRREDADWNDPSPVVLHDDVFSMMRSPSHKWTAVKFWCALAASSFQQLVSPTAPFPELKHLSLNAVGNCSLKPLDDVVPAVEIVADKKKADAKGKKGAVEEVQTPKFLFPALESCTVADVNERVEFASELAVKLSAASPVFHYFNVANTHRSGPTKAPPVQGKPKRAA